jgi:hypothetical protein
MSIPNTIGLLIVHYSVLHPEDQIHGCPCRGNQAFLDYIREEKELKVTGEHGRRALHAVLAAAKSIPLHEPVNLLVTDEDLSKSRP